MKALGLEQITVAQNIRRYMLNQSLSIHHEVIHDPTLAHGKMKTAGDYWVRHLSP